MKRSMAGKIVWSDKKLFTDEMAHNRHNDQVNGKTVLRFQLKRKESVTP